jgi:medium-chain acyl-[acyl-carrier-protein] hydrolase
MSNLPFNPWVSRPEPNPGAQLRLFCFPYAGGGTSIFHAWPNGLPREVEVCSLRLPGRESRVQEAPFDRLPPTVQSISDAILPYLDKPFAFFGHSMGALIAFELVRHLRGQQRATPVHLFVSGCSAPQLYTSEPPIHQLPHDAFIEELRRLGGTPDEVLQNNEILELLLPALRADFAVCEEYLYLSDGPLDCPISAFGGQNDPEVTEEALAAWREQTRGAFALQLFEGNHFFLHSARGRLLESITGALFGAVKPRSYGQ